MTLLNKIKSKYASQSGDVKGLASSVLWSILGTLGSRVLMFIVWIAVAKILGKEGFGEYGLIRNTALTFSTFAGFGLGLTGTKFIAENLKKDKGKAGRIASLTLTFSAITGSIITLLVILFSDYIATNTLKAPELRSEFIIAAFVLWFCAYNGAQIGVMNGLKRFKETARISVVNSILCLPLYIVGAYFGVFWSVMAYAASNLILCLQTGYAIGKAEKEGIISINYKSGWKEWRLLYRYSLPATLSGLLISPIKWVSEIILVNNAGFAAMGIFSAVLTLQIIVRNIANTMTSPFISYMSSKEAESDIIDKLNILAPWLLGMIICLPFMSFPQLGGWMFGKEYQGTVFDETFMYVMLFTLIIMYKQGMSRIFAVKNMQWVGFLSNSIWGATLLLSFHFLKKDASIGLAISYCIAYIFVTMVMYPIYIKRKWVPMEFIFSKWVITLWGIVAMLIYLSYHDINIYIRALIFIISTTITLYVFYKLFKSKVKYSIM